MGSIRRQAGSATAQPAGQTEQAAPTPRCDVLVIGASGGGMQAASVAAACGARVILLDSARSLAVAERLSADDFSWLPGHTALELLRDAAGAVRGAAGVQGEAETPWRIEAAAVVIATAEGLLMAAEAGAQLGGMEEGHGGLRLRGEGYGGISSVDGLYAAGQAAWSALPPDVGLPRGTQAQALWSGQQAGSAAAAAAQAYLPLPGELLTQAGIAGLRGSSHRPANPVATLAALQAILAGLGEDDEVAQASRAAQALGRLDALWQFLCHAAPAPQGARCASRAAAGRVAQARWQLRSRLEHLQAPHVLCVDT
eukprot:Opistho-2@26204